MGRGGGTMAHYFPMPSGIACDYARGSGCWVAPGDTYVQVMCRGRHRVENRVGDVRTSLIDLALLSSIDLLWGPAPPF